RPGTTAPFSLITYRQASARADTIAEVVAEQRMPPWYGSGEFGTFINHRGLTADERETILQWVRSGKERGDESKMPKELTQVEPAGKWRLGTPDVITPEKEVHKLPAEGVIAYQYAVLPHTFEHDTWVQGVEILPDNPRVVHHCNLLYFDPKEGM